MMGYASLPRRPRFEIFAEKNSEGEIKVGKVRRYRWRLIAANDEVVAQSEAYINKRDCEKTVASLRRIATEGSRWIYYLDQIEPSRSTGKWRNPLEPFIVNE